MGALSHSYVRSTSILLDMILLQTELHLDEIHSKLSNRLRAKYVDVDTSNVSLVMR